MRRLSFFLIFAMVAATAAAQVWEKKPYAQWSGYDAIRVTDSSPWAQQYYMFPRTSNMFGLETNPTLEQPSYKIPKLTYVVQFRTALPVRQAMVRLVQLNTKYDQMDATRKTAFDQSNQRFLAPATNAIYVIVSFSYSETRESEHRGQAITSYWSEQTEDALKRIFTMTLPDGRTLNPESAKFSGGIELVFRRPKDLKPEGKLTFQFDSPGSVDIPARSVVLHFNLEKMTVKGALEI